MLIYSNKLKHLNKYMYTSSSSLISQTALVQKIRQIVNAVLTLFTSSNISLTAVQYRSCNILYAIYAIWHKTLTQGNKTGLCCNAYDAMLYYQLFIYKNIVDSQTHCAWLIPLKRKHEVLHKKRDKVLHDTAIWYSIF